MKEESESDDDEEHECVGAWLVCKVLMFEHTCSCCSTNFLVAKEGGKKRAMAEELGIAFPKPKIRSQYTQKMGSCCNTNTVKIVTLPAKTGSDL